MKFEVQFKLYGTFRLVMFSIDEEELDIDLNDEVCIMYIIYVIIWVKSSAILAHIT